MKIFSYEQVDMFSKNLAGSRDCLVLNVYSRHASLPVAPSEKPLLPVMVFIHGGGFFAGSGGVDFYGPQFLMDQEIVG